MEYNIHEPWKTLDDWQKKYIATEGNCFLLCGRQSGKTTAMSIKFGDRAVNKPKSIIGMFAFTEKQAYNLFFKTLMYLKARHPDKIDYKGDKKPTKHVIHLENGSQIMCYAVGLDGAGIRTFTLTDLVIDEAAPMAREVFVSLTPMLSVTKGSLDISSTPRGKEGYFYECSDDVSLGKKIKKNWTRFYVDGEDCPRHSKQFLEEEREAMTKLEYATEYNAKFLDDVKQFFPDELIKAICKGKRRPFIIPGRYYYGGDVARRDKDEFTHEIVDIVKDRLIHVENIMTKNVPIPESCRTIIELNGKYKFKKEYIDSGGMGITVCDILRESPSDKNKVVEINNASRIYERESGSHPEKTKKLMKEELYKNLLRLMEQNKVILLDDEEVMLSLKSILMDFTGRKGEMQLWGRYSHITEGIIRACWGIKDKSFDLWIR